MSESFFNEDFSNSFFNQEGEVNELSLLQNTTEIDKSAKKSENEQDENTNEEIDTIEENLNLDIDEKEKENEENVAERIPDRPIKKPQIHNIVATVNMKTKVDCKNIAHRAKNASYNPKRFPAVTIHLKHPQTTAFVFSTGKVTVLGAKSIDDAKFASRRIARIVQKIGYPDVKWTEFKVSNMVASGDVGFKVNLQGLAIEHAEFSSYEPELFPGCVYKMHVPKATLLIFVSGKVVITSKTEEFINTAFENIYPILIGFKQKIML